MNYKVTYTMMDSEELLKQVKEYFPKLDWQLNTYSSRDLIETSFYFYTIHFSIPHDTRKSYSVEINPLMSTNISISNNDFKELLHQTYEHLAQEINEARGMINKR